MSIFKKRKDSSRHPVMPLAAVNVDIALHRFLLDTGLAEYQQLGTLAGLSPMDEEEAAEERAESDARAIRLIPLLPLLSMYSSVLSTSTVEYLRTLSDGEGLSDDEAERMMGMLSRLTMSALMGSVSQLEDLGLVRYSYRA